MRANSLQKAILQELGPDQMHELATELGTTDRAAKKLVGTAVESLTGTLADEASSPEGAREVAQAFSEAPDPAGQANARPLTGVAQFAGGGMGGIKGGILASVLGRVTLPVAKAVSARTGLPVTQVNNAMRVILPIAMTVLSQVAKKKNVSASGLSDMLSEEQQHTQESGGLMGMLGKILGGGGEKARAA
ncbi:DUF937 domain-containing protein [Streptomyces sp. A7024]|uniref:DUF937 domain-containing protein n=1 Tax=Streptomyces coryli TaxID=1128680 RepID=A0A6G4UDC4_9ACTN|nr:DUF937 domain-containing protein [Streptomyces coryli]NGN70012.1 DUF937 domain-containing protein [Streptomyces coryli]